HRHKKIFQNGCQQQFYKAQSFSRQQKKMKSFSFTTLDEPLANILDRLIAKGLLQLKKGFLPKYPSPNFDLSKICSYHSSIQGHNIENFPTLRFKFQSMIESHKIKLLQEPPTSNDDRKHMHNLC
ncbi:hypothetical protein HAX54_051592, partial [Datura stramonium]|nr:hypothetical protein [Datura stramonium]